MTVHVTVQAVLYVLAVVAFVVTYWHPKLLPVALALTVAAYALPTVVS